MTDVVDPRAWPPAPLPIDRTDGLAQAVNHPADHNMTNQAVNDLVAKVSQATAIPGAYRHVQGFGFSSLNTGQMWASLVVPEAAAERVLLISYHCLVSLPAPNAVFDVALRINGNTLAMHRVPAGPREHSIDLFAPTSWGPAAVAIDVFVPSIDGGGTSGTVYANLPYHRLAVAWYAGGNV